MTLSLADVARIFSVPERTVSRWIEDDNLPVEFHDSHYQFNRAELVEWATLKRLTVPSGVFVKTGPLGLQQTLLTAALERGGIAYQVQGAEKRTALRSVIEGLPLASDNDREVLLQLVLGREALGSTGLGDGVAVPHPRKPMVMDVDEPLARLCFLARPLEFDAPDGRPVHTLFVMVCPTVHVHLELLARLAAILKEETVKKTLRERQPAAEILAAFRRAEQAMAASPDA